MVCLSGLFYSTYNLQKMHILHMTNRMNKAFIQRVLKKKLFMIKLLIK